MVTECSKTWLFACCNKSCQGRTDDCGYRTGKGENKLKRYFKSEKQLNKNLSHWKKSKINWKLISRFEHNSKVIQSRKKTKNNQKKTKKTNFGILPNLIQKRQKTTRIENKNYKKNEKTTISKLKTNRKKKGKSSFLQKKVWILQTLTQPEHFCWSQKGPLQLCKLISMSENPRDRDLSVNISMIIHIDT